MGDSYRRPRERERERDAKDSNVEFFGGGESYRPGGHSGQGPYRPPHSQSRDSWTDRKDPRDAERRDARDTPRRDVRREEIDSYVPPTSTRARRDSRSPPPQARERSPDRRDRGDLFPEQARSPPRRFSPRRDERPRSPPRRRSRSPLARARSPVRRGRDYSPPRSPRRDRSPRYDRARSPPRRPYSPPRDTRYRSRSRSPRRTFTDDNWRRGRSPSPRAGSSVPSRRSSPPVRPDRSVPGSAPRSPHRSPPREPRNGDFQPPSGPARNGYDRPPPSGPSRSFSSGQTPPAGPAGYRAPPSGPRGGGDRFDNPRKDYSNPAMMGRSSLVYRAPTAPRAPTYGESGTQLFTPPSGPRSSSFRGDHAPAGRGDYPSAGRGDSSSSGRGDYSSAGRGDFSSAGRGDFSSAGRGDYSSAGRGDYRPSYPPRQTDFAFRASNNSSSSTYPRTQRFNTTQQHLATTEKILPGGKLLPSGLTLEQEKRARQLEAEAERIRADIAEKQAAKREAVNEWETRQRESSRDAYRSELADEGLKALGDTEEMAAF